MKRFALAVGTFGVFAALCVDSTLRLPDVYPSITRCRENPARYEGKTVRLMPSKVVKSERQFFVVEHWGKWIRVHSPYPAPVGAIVTVHGTFQIDKSVVAISWADEPNYRIKRDGVLVVSFLVLVAGVFVWRRTFAWRDGAFHVREPHSAVALQKPLDGI